VRATVVTAVTAVTALAVGMAALGGGQFARRVTDLATPPEPPRLIVLPFDNYGPEERSTFALGITDEITSQLSMVPRLRVISRTTAVNYGRRFETVRQVAEDLDVDYILEGSVRWRPVPMAASGSGITPQLIRPPMTPTSGVRADRTPVRAARRSERDRSPGCRPARPPPEAASAAAADLDAAAYHAFLDGRPPLLDEEQDYRPPPASRGRSSSSPACLVRGRCCPRPMG
jgi:hypothetical protein